MQEAILPHAPTPVSKLDAFKPYIVDRLRLHPDLTSIRLLREIKERGYAGGVALIKRYVRLVRAPRARKAYTRVETEPGEHPGRKDWGKIFQNSAAASAIADRLVHRGILIRIAGKSRRSDQEVE